MSLLYGAVPAGLPAPLAVQDPFLRHTCERRRSRDQHSASTRIPYVFLEFLMAANDEDFPVSYVFYMIGVILVMAFLIIGGSFLWLR